MFNDVNQDLHFYQKMSEVYTAASKAFKANMEAEKKAKKEREAAGINTDLTEESPERRN